MTCEAKVQPTCQIKLHDVYDSEEDLAEFQVGLDKALEDFKKSDEVRGQLKENLMEKFRCMWAIVDAQVIENKKCREKIRAAIVGCQEMGKQSPTVKVYLKEKLKEKKKMAKDELEQAVEQLRNQKTSMVSVTEVILIN